MRREEQLRQSEILMKQLEQNFNALMEAIVKARPSAVKGQFLRSITLSSTMGPGVKVNVAKY